MEKKENVKKRNCSFHGKSIPRTENFRIFLCWAVALALLQQVGTLIVGAEKTPYLFLPVDCFPSVPSLPSVVRLEEWREKKVSRKNVSGRNFICASVAKSEGASAA